MTITKKCWHHTVSILIKVYDWDQTQGLAFYCHNWSNSAAKFYNEDQIKGWHSTVIISQILQQEFYDGDQTQGLAFYCHNWLNSTAKILQWRSTKNTGIILSQSWSKFMTEIKPRRWHRTATNQLLYLSDQILSGGSDQCQAGYQFDNQFNPSTRTDRSQFQLVISGGWGQWIRQEIIGNIR